MLIQRSLSQPSATHVRPTLFPAAGLAILCLRAGVRRLAPRRVGDVGDWGFQVSFPHKAAKPFRPDPSNP